MKTKDCVTTSCAVIWKCPCGEQKGKALSGANFVCAVANSIFHPKV